MENYVFKTRNRNSNIACFLSHTQSRTFFSVLIFGSFINLQTTIPEMRWRISNEVKRFSCLENDKIIGLFLGVPDMYKIESKDLFSTLQKILQYYYSLYFKKPTFRFLFLYIKIFMRTFIKILNPISNQPLSAPLANIFAFTYQLLARRSIFSSDSLINNANIQC